MIELDPTRSWKPMLEGGQAQEAWQIVLDIGESMRSILRSQPKSLSPSLGNGSAGIALFLDCLHASRPGEGWDALAMDALNHTIERMAEEQHRFVLNAGIPGAAWVFEHLEGRLFEAEEEGPNDTDLAFQTYLKGQAISDFGFLEGLSGLGLYALKRFPGTEGDDILNRIVDRLAQAAEKNGLGFAWPAPQQVNEALRKDYPQGYYNLGAAHGTPGIMGILARAWGRGYRHPDLETLLEGAVNWTLDQRRGESNGPHFPKAVPRREGAPFPLHPRTAWCYGDLGISVLLLSVSRWTGRPAWEVEALDLARGVTRWEMTDLDRRDACLCHGTAGNAHLFNRLYQATGEVCFRKSASKWLEETFCLRKPGEGVGGFVAWKQSDPEDPNPWKDEPGLLGGAAGIGLVLLSALSSVAPSWDEILLADIPETHRSALSLTRVPSVSAHGFRNDELDYPETSALIPKHLLTTDTHR